MPRDVFPADITDPAAGFATTTQSSPRRHRGTDTNDVPPIRVLVWQDTNGRREYAETEEEIDRFFGPLIGSSWPGMPDEFDRELKDRLGRRIEFLKADLRNMQARYGVKAARSPFAGSCH